MDGGDFIQAAVVALGGNLPGACRSVADLLDAALARLAQEDLRLLARSRWWRSAAWPDPSAPAFLNGVALFETELGPQALLALFKSIEREFGRSAGPRNAPRTLDLDLIALGPTLLQTPDLQLPHPRAAERLFVMGPLAEIAPAWVHPGLGRTAAQLAGAATVGRDAAPLS
jgi:2-amino-4-hydroxy-6-hydroxymethyldihydropteridine diphosphokinase